MLMMMIRVFMMIRTCSLQCSLVLCSLRTMSQYPLVRMMERPTTTSTGLEDLVEGC